ncbi:MAG TPA: hypothetical protein VJ461_05545 [Candidatus Nanoarchaeia archaeon]|nr:hypothetical protein [Candidatus Nanoarchaeia archaeon]
MEELTLPELLWRWLVIFVIVGIFISFIVFYLLSTLKNAAAPIT